MMSELLPRLVLPLGIALFALILALPRAGRGRRPLLLGLLVLLVFSLPAVSNALIRSLENDYPFVPLERLPEMDTVVILGGGLQLQSPPRRRAELGPGADRLWLAAELWHAGKARRLLVSSGARSTRSAGATEPDEGVLSARILADWGVPPGVIATERRSLNTSENAAETAALLRVDGEAGSEPTVGLITSASHMPRAMTLFRAEGLEPIALPADHWVAATGTLSALDWVPSAIHLGGSTRALREYLGIAWYLATGRVRWRDLRLR